MTGTWSLGVLVGLPVAAAIVAALIVASRYAAHRSHTASGIMADDDRKLLRGLSIASLAATAVPVGITALTMWPYSAQYHRWEPKTGVVGSVSKRLIGDGDNGMSQRFVVSYRESGRQYGCDDTRCALIRPGDRLTLMCKREWQYSGTDGWSCNFGRVEAGRG